MLNHSLLGDYEARLALQEASLKLEVGTDWCVGGCKNYRETEDGLARYGDLKKRWEAHENNNEGRLADLPRERGSALWRGDPRIVHAGKTKGDDMTAPTLFVVVGPPGSGKSTFCGRLREHGVIHLSRSDVRSQFGEYSDRKRIQVMRVLEGYVKGHLLDGRSVVFDANNVEIDQRAEVLMWAKDLWLAYHIKVRKVLLFFPSRIEDCLTRRGPDIESGKLDEKVLKRQYYSLVVPSTKESAHVFYIDAHLSPVEAVLHGPIRPFVERNLTAPHLDTKEESNGRSGSQEAPL